MKNLPKLLNTPVKIVFAAGAIIMLGELLIMLLLKSMHGIMSFPR